MNRNNLISSKVPKSYKSKECSSIPIQSTCCSCEWDESGQWLGHLYQNYLLLSVKSFGSNSGS